MEKESERERERERGRGRERRPQRAGIYDQCFRTVIVLYLKEDVAMGYDLC